MAVDTDRLEQWKVEGRGTVGIVRLDQSGHEKIQGYRGGRTFYITPEERRLNESRVRTDKLNPFRNGLLTRLKLVEDDADFETLAANVDAPTEAEIVGLFDLHWKAFDARLAEITSTFTLDRIMRAGREINATPRALTAVKNRIDELTPKRAVAETNFRAPGDNDPDTPLTRTGSSAVVEP